MNRKSFLILLLLLIVVGGAGLALFWQDLSAWRSPNAKIGTKLFEKLPVNDVAQIVSTTAKAPLRSCSRTAAGS